MFVRVIYTVSLVLCLTSVFVESNVNRKRSVATEQNGLLPDRKNCGRQNVDRIFGGTFTDLSEYPWLALLSYKDNADGSTRFACGGSLISKRYILTAAHCDSDDDETLIGVRLGEWNLDTEEDCIEKKGFTDCNDPHIDVGVESVSIHPEYEPDNIDAYHDIALVRLNRTIAYTLNIKPICLPLPKDSPDIGEILWVAGWGATEKSFASNIKLKVDVPIVPRTECRNTFQEIGITIWSTQLCAGGVENKDSCTGDSGGPLMQLTQDTRQHVAQGVVSFGSEKCGSKGWPGIYTKVSMYLDWITETVEP